MSSFEDFLFNRDDGYRFALDPRNKYDARFDRQWTRIQAASERGDQLAYENMLRDRDRMGGFTDPGTITRAQEFTDRDIERWRGFTGKSISRDRAFRDQEISALRENMQRNIGERRSFLRREMRPGGSLSYAEADRGLATYARGTMAQAANRRAEAMGQAQAGGLNAAFARSSVASRPFEGSSDLFAMRAQRETEIGQAQAAARSGFLDMKAAERDRFTAGRQALRRDFLDRRSTAETNLLGIMGQREQDLLNLQAQQADLDLSRMWGTYNANRDRQDSWISGIFGWNQAKQEQDSAEDQAWIGAAGSLAAGLASLI